MFKTFRASIETGIETELVNKGTVYRFDNNPSVEWVMYDIRHEIFEFSKEDVIFSRRQKEKYKKSIQLNPFGGSLFADGVKYKLHRAHKKGKTLYYIEIGDQKPRLKLNWYNKQKIEWVHGKKINWAVWQALGSVGVVVIMILVFFIPTKTKNVDNIKPETLRLYDSTKNTQLSDSTTKTIQDDTPTSKENIIIRAKNIFNDSPSVKPNNNENNIRNVSEENNQKSSEIKWIACTECGGNGTIKMHTRCNSCAGTGKTICTQCGGTGKWGDIYPTKGIYETPPCSKCSGTGKSKCANCSGTGEVNIVKTCSKCNGTGRIHQQS